MYRVVAGTELAVKVHLPDESVDRPYPAIVFFHGGGWVNKMWPQFHRHAEWLAAHGAVGMEVEYRLLNQDAETVFDCIADAHAAVRWVRSQADVYGIDPHRIGAGGGSAGGHLAAATAFLADPDDDADKTVSSRPDVLTLFNPVIDTTQRGYGHERFGDDPEAGSPVHHVEPGAPPTVVLCGREDTITPYENVERFQRRMAEVGNACRLVGYDGEGHGFFNAIFEETWLREVVPFLRETGFLGEA